MEKEKTAYSETLHSLLDYLRDDRFLPETIDSPAVKAIWTTPFGQKFGVNMAEALNMIRICERKREHGTAGKLTCVPGEFFLRTDENGNTHKYTKEYL